MSGPLLMRHPTANATHVVFSFAGDLWSVARQGGDAVRLTTSAGTESDPTFSPDGKRIAFTGQYSGTNDVYVMDAGGGEPQRLTYYAGNDTVIGWTPDGQSVLFSSTYETETDLPALYTVPMTGGMPQRLPLPSGTHGSYSPDGRHLAYDPGFRWQAAWKRYRGGQTSKVWIADLSDSQVKEVPRKNSNDTNALWTDGAVFFLSDRNGPTTLFSYDLRSGKVAERVKPGTFEMKSATVCGTTIAFERLGEIGLFDTSTGQVSIVDVRIAGEFPESRPQYKSVAPLIASSNISPTGVRAVFEARGDIYTVPAAKGDIKNLTQTSGVMERSPAWSPDGQSVCYLSDEGGEYRLVVRPASGSGEPKSYVLGEAPAFYYGPTWSPDSTKVAYSDNRNSVWYLDLKSGKNVKVDVNPYVNPTYVLSPSWSPDSKWLTYRRDLDSHLSAVFVYSLESGKATQLTDGLGDARNPVFDVGGKYLYFTASTNSGHSNSWLDLSSYRSINQDSSVYVTVLRNDLPSPLAPESDDEAVKTPDAPKTEPKKEEFRIDLDRIRQRILALPLPAKNYQALLPGPADSVLAADTTAVASILSQPRVTLTKFSLATRSATPLTSDFGVLSVTPNGEKMLVGRGPLWAIVPTAAPSGPGQGALDLSSMSTKVEPMDEWRQMYREAWRIQRDFLYDPNFHGIDLKSMERKYEPFVANVRSRNDLNYLFEDMLGEICIGHMFVGGGDVPSVAAVPGGLLGADYKLEQGRYRFARVYDGENWNPSLRAPLTQPGVNVVVGEFLLAVNGRELTAKDSVHQVLEATAGKQVRIKVGPNADGSKSREVTVVPVPSEAGLRHLAWREDNLRKVEKLSNGRLGYMHIPDTNVGGWTNFNRYFYAQVGKEGIVIDERFNHGGQVDDFMVDNLNRPLRSRWASRYGKDFSSPLGAIYGPKVMIVNEYAGSGGDYFPWHFRQAKVGPIVGKRTWGGLVGILNFPSLMDGGGVTAPNIAFYNLKGEWEVENHGVDPDIEVEMDPALWRKGHDPQLERAVDEAMKLLAKNPSKPVVRPAYQDKSRTPGG